MLRNFTITHNRIFLYLTDGKVITVSRYSDTGRIIKRPKIHFILKYLIDHKGIILGKLANGTILVLHNHTDDGFAVVTTLKTFNNGVKSYFDDKHCTNGVEDMLTIALNDVIQGKPYDELNWNCQVYVNKACSNEHKSDDVGRVVAGVALTIGAGFLLSALFRGK